MVQAGLRREHEGGAASGQERQAGVACPAIPGTEAAAAQPQRAPCVAPPEGLFCTEKGEAAQPVSALVTICRAAPDLHPVPGLAPTPLGVSTGIAASKVQTGSNVSPNPAPAPGTPSASSPALVPFPSPHLLS